MPCFTIDSIRENPWNAVEQDIPADADSYLLNAAFEAAKYCAASENDFMLAAREGDYTPADWVLGDGDVHEAIENRFLKAADRLSDLSKWHAHLSGNSILRGGGVLSIHRIARSNSKA